MVGMILHERIIVALHRLAQENASARYFGWPARASAAALAQRH